MRRYRTKREHRSQVTGAHRASGEALRAQSRAMVRLLARCWGPSSTRCGHFAGPCIRFRRASLRGQDARGVARWRGFWLGVAGVAVGAVCQAVCQAIVEHYRHNRDTKAQRELDDRRKALLRVALENPPAGKDWRELTTLSRIIGADFATTTRLLIELDARGSGGRQGRLGALKQEALTHLELRCVP